MQFGFRSVCTDPPIEINELRKFRNLLAMHNANIHIEFRPGKSLSHGTSLYFPFIRCAGHANGFLRFTASVQPYSIHSNGSHTRALVCMCDKLASRSCSVLNKLMFAIFSLNQNELNDHDGRLKIKKHVANKIYDSFSYCCHGSMRKMCLCWGVLPNRLLE